MTAPRTQPRALRPGFTLAELVVVTVIILIVLLVAVPAFSGMLYSSERALAENALRAGVSAARDAAVRAEGGGDGAAVFLFEGGRVRIVPAVQVGSIEDVRVDGSGGGATAGPLGGPATVVRDVFVPLGALEPVQLPRFWSVRGYASPATVGGDWYNGDLYGSPDAQLEGNWVFPESAFYDAEAQTTPATLNAAGIPNRTGRQAFMIRFEARTGLLRTGGRPALFVDPRPSTENRPAATDPDAWKRPDTADSLARWASDVLNRPKLLPSGQPPFHPDEEAERRRLIGNVSNDAVLVGAVSRLALYDERRLGAALGARRLNDETGSLYAPVEPGATGGDALIRIDETLFSNAPETETLRVSINRWVQGDTAPRAGYPSTPFGDGLVNADDSPESRVFVVDPSGGALTEVLQ